MNGNPHPVRAGLPNANTTPSSGKGFPYDGQKIILQFNALAPLSPSLYLTTLISLSPR